MRNSTKRIAALLLTLVLLLTCFTWPAYATKTYKGTVTKDRIFFRSGASTSAGYIGRVNKGDKVEVIAIKGDFYKVKFNGKTGYVMCKFVNLASSAVKALKKAAAADAPKKTATPKPTATPKKTTTQQSSYKTQNLKWYNTGKNLFKRDSTFTIKDVKTGKKWECKVLYGSSHLDAEPLTKADTNKMKSAYGGSFNYKRRPVLVLYKGKVYAGSLYGVPHGEQTITNNAYNGQFCIHFTGSKTHGSNKVDADHQDAIQKALQASW